MASNNEAKIKFTADVSDFNSSIKDAKDETKQLNAEMRLNEATFKNTGDSAEYLANKHDLLEQKLKANQQQQEALNGKIEAATEYFGEDSDEVAKLELELTRAETAEQNLLAQIDSVNDQIEEQANEAESSTSALDQLTQTISDQESELASLKDEYTNAVLEYGATSDEAQELAGQISTLSSELADNKATLEDARAGADAYDESLDGIGDMAGSLPGPLGQVSGGVMNIANAFATGGIIGLTGELVDKAYELAQAAFEMAQEWQEAEASIATGTGLVGDELDDLTDKAYNAAGAIADINFDGKTSADVIAELNTRLGLTGEEAEAVTEDIAKFAKANGEDAVPAVDTLVNMMHRYGIEADDLPSVLDKLTVAQQATQYSASDMADAVEKNAPSFKALGFSMDESLSYMMAFADYSDTTYQSAMTGTKKAVTALSEVTSDVPGAFNEAIAVMQSGADMSTILNTEIGDTGKTISDVFGKRSAQDMVDFFQNSQNGIGDYVGALQDCDGAMESTYDSTITMKDALQQGKNMFNILATQGMPAFNEQVEKQGTTVQNTYGIITDENGNMISSYTAMAQGIDISTSDIDSSVSGMSDSVRGSASEMESSVSTSFDTMNANTTASVDDMRQQIDSKNESLRADMSNFATNASSDTVSKFDTMRQQASDKFENLRAKVQERAGVFKGNLSTFGENAKSTIQDSFDNMRSRATDKFENMRSTVGSKANALYSALSSFGTNAKSSIHNAFDFMRSSASSIFSNMHSTVSGWMSRIRGLFNFSWELPRPRLPHINWHWNSIGGLLKIPVFDGISWHAAGGIFNQPTLLQSANGNLHGVGEAGPEAIAPIDTLKDYMIDAVHQVDFSIDYNLLADRIAGAIAGMSMTVDGTALVGAIVKPMDSALGKIQNQRGRGR